MVHKSAKLVYSFPADEPMKIAHANVYKVGTETRFSDNKHFMFVVCGLCTFTFWEPLIEINATSFAEAIMKILLGDGLCHTLVLNKYSKFRGVFQDTMKLIHINNHVESGGHHDPILTERLFRYVNKSLRVINNALGSNRYSTQSVTLQHTHIIQR